MYKVAEAAEILNCSRTTIYNYLDNHEQEIEQNFKRTSQGVKLDQEALEYIAGELGVKLDEEPADDAHKASDEVITELRAQIERLEEELDRRDEIIDNLMDKLDTKDKQIENFQVMLERQREQEEVYRLEGETGKTSIFDKIRNLFRRTD